MVMLPNAYSHCRFTVSDMKSRSAHAFMCVMVSKQRTLLCGGGGGGVCVCVCMCVCMEWGVLLQSPEMKLAFLL